MKIYLATDHAGFKLKEKIKTNLLEKGYDVEDCGAYAFENNDDYPDFISKAAAAVSKNPSAKAIIFGGSGQAEMIVANKFPHIRAVLFYAPLAPNTAADASGRVSNDPFEMIRLTREHNDANILSLGARFLSENDAIKAVEIWLNTQFSGEERHKRRIEKISSMEMSNF